VDFPILSLSYAWLKKSVAVSRKKELTLSCSHLKLSQHLPITFTKVQEVFLDELSPDWTKDIPVTILSSYRRWIDVGYSNWDITPDEPSHIMPVYLDQAKRRIAFTYLIQTTFLGELNRKACHTRIERFLMKF
jgi:hypothetical protein